MLSISDPIRAGNGEYYLSLAATDDYYLKGDQEPPGFWLGEGAKSLGLRGQVEPDAFRNLLRGLSPDGQRALVKNVNGERRAGWDATWSVPKSVSTAWSQATPEVRVQIEEALRVAVERAIRHVETLDIVSRTGPEGIIRNKAKLLFAVFPHSVSRNGEPQLHLHSILLNVGVRADGTTGTLEPKDLFRHKMLLGALFRVELAYQLEKSLGFRAMRDKKTFELIGIPLELMDEFSTRRKEVLEELSKLGLSGAKAAAVAALNTRSSKEAVPREELFKRWHALGKQHHFTAKELGWLIHASFPERNRQNESYNLGKETLTEITDNTGHFSRKEFLTTLLQGAQGRGMSADEVLSLGQKLFQSSEIVPVAVPSPDQRFTTREILQLEKQVIETAGAMAARGSRTIAKLPKVDFPISDEQKQALKLMLGSVPGSLTLLRGIAGAGKTTVFKAAYQAWKDEGIDVLGAALSGKAASELKKASGIEAQTLHSLLWEIRGGARVLSDKTVLVVDEAAMVGTRQLLTVLKLCNQAGARCVLAGDDRQLQAVEHGGGFSALLNRLPSSELTEIFRQKEPWAREAVKEFSRGNSKGGLAPYLDRNLVAQATTEPEALARLVNDWRNRGGIDHPDKQVILAPTNNVVDELNLLAQAQRLQAEALAPQALESEGVRYFVGDRVIFTLNDRQLGLWNGDTGTVQSIRDGKLVVYLDSHETREIDLKRYTDIRLGYAFTVNRTQGATVDNSLVYASNQNRELAYVEASRAKESTRWYLAESVVKVTESMEQSRKKEFIADQVITLEQTLTL
jgi:conjugative relaxase-like TrwC/TraI family protein